MWGCGLGACKAPQPGTLNLGISPLILTVLNGDDSTQHPLVESLFRTVRIRGNLATLNPQPRALRLQPSFSDVDSLV